MNEDDEEFLRYMMDMRDDEDQTVFAARDKIAGAVMGHGVAAVMDAILRILEDMGDLPDFAEILEPTIKMMRGQPKRRREAPQPVPTDVREWPRGKPDWSRRHDEQYLTKREYELRQQAQSRNDALREHLGSGVGWGDYRDLNPTPRSPKKSDRKPQGRSR